MKIFYAEDWTDKALAEAGKDWDRVRTLRSKFQKDNLAETPIYLGIVKGVEYDFKTEQYVLKTESSIIKITNEVSGFLLEQARLDSNFGGKPTTYAKMADGIIIDVSILFASREV